MIIRQETPRQEREAMLRMEYARLFFHVTLLATAVSGEFQVQSPDAGQVVEVGRDATLPCRVLPPIRWAGLQVHWFRSLFHSTALLLKSGKEEREQQSAQFSGRAFLRGAPETGELTLLLREVTLSDADTYHCLVQNLSSGHYEEALTQLTVIGTGSLPVTSISLKDGALMVSFLSSDWFPRPEMYWELDGIPVTIDVESVFNQTNGLYRLESSVLLRDPPRRHLYCAARHPVTGRVSGMYLEMAEDIFPRLSAWLYACLFLVLLLTAGAALMLVTIRRKIAQREALQLENGRLSAEVDWRRAVMSPELLTLSPETAHPELSVSRDFLTLINQPPSVAATPSNARFDTERCCLGLPSFSSGCHYWEVEVGEGVEWAVGVTSPQLQRKGHAYMFRPEELIWCISRFIESLKALDTPERQLTVTGDSLPKVGVYLKLTSSRTVTFYDPRNWNVLYTFSDVGHGGQSVVPFFWLGKNGETVRLFGQQSAPPEQGND